MNLFLTGKAMLALTAVALLLYGFSPVLNGFLGVEYSLFSEPWMLLALALGASITAGFLLPYLIGVRKGDSLLASVTREVLQGDKVVVGTDLIPVTALNSGRLGSKIKIAFQNGLVGEGIITSYASTISPPTLKLTETEGSFKKVGS
ncbi:MAG: hypothetical protein ABH803_02150 [Candidatus Micrarchaeota archaeon]